MALSERLQIIVTADAKGAARELKSIGDTSTRELGKADQKLKQLSASFTAFGAAALGAGAIATAGIFKLAQAAGDYGEAVSAATQVFGDEAVPVLEEFGKKAIETSGLSRRAAVDAARSFGTLGKSAGLLGNDLVDFSTDLTTLAGDLASFFNTSTDDALQAIQSGLQGQSEPLRRYGVFLDDLTLKEKARELGIYKGNAALTAQQKVLAANAVIFAQTTDAQGDFVRTSDSLSNQTRSFSAEIENLKVAIGEGAVPVFSELLGAASGLLDKFQGLGEGTQKLIGKIAAYAALGTAVVGATSLAAGAVLRLSAAYTLLASSAGSAAAATSTANAAAGASVAANTAAAAATRGSAALGALGIAAKGAGLALGTLVVSDIAFTAINNLNGVAEKGAAALDRLSDAAARGASTFEPFADAVAAEELTLRWSGLWEDFGAEIELVGTGIKAGVEDVQRTFDQFNPELQSKILDDLEAATAALDKNSDQYRTNTEFIDRNRTAVRFAGLDQVYLGKVTADTARSQDYLAGSTADAAGSLVDASEATERLEGAVKALEQRQKLMNLQWEAGEAAVKGYTAAVEQSSRLDNLVGAAIGAGRALRRLRDGFKPQTEATSTAAKTTDVLSESLNGLDRRAQQLDPSLSAIGIRLGALSAAADGFRRGIDESTNLDNRLGSAIDFGGAFKDFSRIAKRLPAEIDLVSITTGKLTRRQREALETVRRTGSATKDYLASLIETGKTSGEVTAEAARLREEFTKQLRAAGLTEEQIKKYLEVLGLTPEQVSTAIKVAGIEESRFKLDAYLKLLNGKIPPEVATQVVALIEKGDLDAAAKLLANFAKTNPVDIEVKPTTTPSGVQEGVNNASKQIKAAFEKVDKIDPIGILLGDYSEEQLDFLDEVIGFGKAASDALAQLFAKTKQDTGSTAEALATVTTAAGDLRAKFVELLNDNGITDSGLIAQLTELAGLSDPQIKVGLDGAMFEESVAKINILLGLLGDDLTPEEKWQIATELLDDDTLGAIAVMETALERLEESREIDIQTDQAQKNIRDLFQLWEQGRQSLFGGSFFTGPNPFMPGLDFGGLNPVNPAPQPSPPLGARPTTPKRPWRGFPYKPGYNSGGIIPGTGPDRDSVLAFLTPGEFVVKRKAVDMYGEEFLKALNAGQLEMPQFNTGGIVGRKSKDVIPAPDLSRRDDYRPRRPDSVDRTERLAAAITKLADAGSAQMPVTFNVSAVEPRETALEVVRKLSARRDSWRRSAGVY
jgi:hypothetical protein